VIDYPGALFMDAFYEPRDYDGNDFKASFFWTRGLSFAAHWHDDIEIVYIESGELILGINTMCRLLSAESLAICGSNEIHYYKNAGACHFLVLKFPPEQIGYTTRWPSGRLVTTSFLTPGEDSVAPGLRKRLIELIVEADREWKEALHTRAGGSSLIIRAKFMEFCGLVERRLTEPLSATSRTAKSSGKLERLQSAIEFIRTNSSGSVRLEDVAEIAHLSQGAFSRTFSALTGSSFHFYLNSVRVEKAIEIMRSEPDKKILDVALDCGFESLRTFNRAFKQIKGLTPRESRKAPGEEG
jgi:AraC-like DNA-binding protein